LRNNTCQYLQQKDIISHTLKREKNKKQNAQAATGFFKGPFFLTSQKIEKPTIPSEKLFDLYLSFERDSYLKK